jgi:hypothetical protein
MRYGQPAAHMIEVQSIAHRVLIIPGLDGTTGLWRSVASTVLPGLRPLWFDHSMDRAADGLSGLARRALAVLDADGEAMRLRTSAVSPSEVPSRSRWPGNIRIGFEAWC